MDLAFMNDYVVFIVVAFCVAVGYIIKHSLNFISNKYIPLIMGVCGVVFNIFVNNWTVTPTIIVAGLISGLSSTGLHEAYRHLINKNSQNNNVPTENNADNNNY